MESALTWISLEAPKLESLPATSNVEVSRDGHDPISVSWILDGGGFMAQVVLWESGEFESDLADVETGSNPYSVLLAIGSCAVPERHRCALASLSAEVAAWCRSALDQTEACEPGGVEVGHLD
ncbi:hypothetical protein ABTZ99_17675 [Actinosynnema sp. NPDC002837]